MLTRLFQTIIIVSGLACIHSGIALMEEMKAFEKQKADTSYLDKIDSCFAKGNQPVVEYGGVRCVEIKETGWGEL